ncbi:hypothetical protein U1Q18_016491 [Sarracenia purpurea var. burkii]
MEREESTRDDTEVRKGLFSCWGCLKLKLPWRRRERRRRTSGSRRRRTGNGWNIRNIFKLNRPRPAAGGGFRSYDPLSYSQNFDDGWGDEDDEDSTYNWFSSRYAPPPQLKSAPSISM